MQGKANDLVGQVFTRLTVIRREPHASKERYWLCQCSCGNLKVARGSHLKSGNIQSCGCLAIETATHHGYAYTATHRAWRHMKNRCYNTKDKNYARWGGRGIIVCDRWKHSFENFLQDMGEKPNGTSLGRIDNDGNYEPGNCRWETPFQQASNTRRTVKMTYKGMTLTAKLFSEITGLNYATVKDRIKRGVPPDQVLSLKSLQPKSSHLDKRIALYSSEGKKLSV